MKRILVDHSPVYENSPKTVRFDHYIAKHLRISERSARTRIAQGEFSVNGVANSDLQRRITRFDEVATSDTVLQKAITPLYIALHKPVGIVSATIDETHTTVVDLIDHPDKGTLHIAGRLDRSSSGLVLLTNDGNWSDFLTRPESKVAKVYLVETDRPIPDSAAEQFAEGFDFASEGIKTRPALLEKLGPTTARVVIHEGRWHQIKRMFHRMEEIRLTSLHRESIGPFRLDGLVAGEWREIKAPFSKEISGSVDIDRK